jgi:hypothetical protein
MATPSGSRSTLLVKIALVLVGAGVVLYAIASYASQRAARGAAAVARELTTALGSIGFKRIEHFPSRAIVVYGRDTVGSVTAGGHFHAATDSAGALLLLGLWKDTEGARHARNIPDLSGRLEVSSDSTRMIVYLQPSAGPDTNKVRGYLLLAPDSRWVRLH